MAADQPPEGCIEKAAWESRFCVETVEWDPSIKDAFAVNTALYSGTKSIVRYDNGRVTRVFALFPATSFIKIVKYLRKEFGVPAERQIVYMPMMESPRIPNTTFRWLGVDPEGEAKAMLEVRAYEDVRRTFPDSTHGFVRLFSEDSTPIFRHINTVDLMVLDRRRLSLGPRMSVTVE